MPAKPLRLFLIAGEASGDQLGADLLAALRIQNRYDLILEGIGGSAMQREGLESLFAMEELSVMGLTRIIPRLPHLLARIRQAANAAIAAKPDALIIIDSPDFTHRVARLVRRQAPTIPIIQMVAPSVWSWRSGRARKMRGYVDHILALLPFEPEILARLGGPPTSYIGHPLIAQHAARNKRIKQDLNENWTPGTKTEAQHLLLLPGSREGEISLHLQLFGKVSDNLCRQFDNIQPVLVTLPRLKQRMHQQTRQWQTPPRIVAAEGDKSAVFSGARAALAVSGTVCLELALAGIPMLIVYRLDWIYQILKGLNNWLPLANIAMIGLPNIVIERKVFPEFVGRDAQFESLSKALAPLLSDTPERQAQLEGMAQLTKIAAPLANISPGQNAAKIIEEILLNHPQTSFSRP